MEPQDDNEETRPNILEVLNPYCFRFIFDNLTIADIVRSERVSRAWRAQVHYYLTGVHDYRIEFDSNVCSVPDRAREYRVITISTTKVLNMREMIQRLGQYFVRLDSNCITEEASQAIVTHCPKLKSLTLTGTHLKNVFDSMGIDQEDLEFPGVDVATINSWELTGSFLLDFRANLKTFGLSFFCNLSFSYEHILAAANRFTSLTRLELSFNTVETLRHVSVLLDQMPLLEHLSLMEYEQYSEPDIDPPCYDRLSRLRELHLWGNEYVTDSWLVAAARCEALRALNIGICTRLTIEAIVTFCRARPELTALVVAGLGVTDVDVGACGRLCPDLQLLDASWCNMLTKDVLRSLERPRLRPLVFRMRATSVPKKYLAIDYEGITIRYNITPDLYNPMLRHFDSGDSDCYARCGSDCPTDCDHDLETPSYDDSDDMDTDEDEQEYEYEDMSAEDDVYPEEGDDEDMSPEYFAHPAEGMDAEEGIRPEDGMLQEDMRPEDFARPAEGMDADEGIPAEEGKLPEEGIEAEEPIQAEEGMHPEEGMRPDNVIHAEEGIAAEEAKQAQEGVQAEERRPAEEAIQAEEVMRPEEDALPEDVVQAEGIRPEAGVHGEAMRPEEVRNPDDGIRVEEVVRAEDLILPVQRAQADDLVLPVERRLVEDLFLPVERRLAEYLLLPEERRPADDLLLPVERRFAENVVLPEQIQAEFAENVFEREVHPDENIPPIVERPDNAGEQLLFIGNGFRNQDADLGIEPLNIDPRNGWVGIDVLLPQGHRAIAMRLEQFLDEEGGPLAQQEAEELEPDLHDAYVIEDDDMFRDLPVLPNGFAPDEDDF